MKKKRTNIINEIITTEESYVKSLENLENIRQFVEKKKLLQPNQLSIIFAKNTFSTFNQVFLKNLKSSQKGSILKKEEKVHKEEKEEPEKEGQKILQSLGFNLLRRSTKSSHDSDTDIKKEETPKKPEHSYSIGKAIMLFSPYFRLYTDYINSFDDSIKELRKARQENPNLDKQLKEMKKQYNEELNSFLIKPIQRIPRYKMLFEELFKATPKEHYDKENISKALTEVSKVAEKLNEQKKKKDSTRVLNNTLNRFDPKTRENFIKPHRHIQKYGHIKLNKNNTWVLCDICLLSDILLIFNCEGGECEPPSGQENLMVKEKEGAKLLVHLVFCTPSKKEESLLDFDLTLHTTGEVVKCQTFEIGEADEWVNDIIKYKNEDISKLGESVKDLNKIYEILEKKRKTQNDFNNTLEQFKQILKSRDERLRIRENLQRKFEDSQLLLKQLSELKSKMEEDNNFIKSCNQRLKKGAGILINKKEELDDHDKCLLGAVRSDNNALVEYYGEIPNLEKLQVRELLVMDDETKETNHIDSNIMSNNDMKNIYEQEIAKLKKELEQANETLTNLQNKYTSETVEKKDPTDLKITLTLERMKNLEEDRVRLLKENKDLVSQLEQKNTLFTNVVKEKNTLKKQIETLQNGKDIVTNTPRSNNVSQINQTEVKKEETKDAKELIQKAKEEAEQIKKNAKEESDKLKKKSQEESESLKKKTEEEINQMKKDALNEIEKMKKEQSNIPPPETKEISMEDRKRSFTKEDIPKTPNINNNPSLTVSNVNSPNLPQNNPSFSAKKELFEKIAKGSPNINPTLRSIKEKKEEEPKKFLVDELKDRVNKLNQQVSADKETITKLQSENLELLERIKKLEEQMNQK